MVRVKEKRGTHCRGCERNIVAIRMGFSVSNLKVWSVVFYLAAFVIGGYAQGKEGLELILKKGKFRLIC